MLTFWTYLWKEWRDHAKTVYVFWGLLVAATGILNLTLPFEKLESGAVPSLLVGGSMMLAIALIAAEVIPGDTRRGTLQFLARTPSGLHTAFWAKLTFALSAILLFGLSAWLVSYMFRVALAPHLWNSLSVASGPVVLIAITVLVVTLWIFAISCWVPNGLLAIPAFGLLTIPYWIWWHLNPQGLHIYPLLNHFYWQPFLALAVAWLSFVVGRRFGRSGAWSGSRGIGITVLGSMPLWVCLWSWHSEFRSFDLHESAILNAWLGKDGKFAFLNLQRHSGRGDFPKFAVKVDLQHGTHELLGEAGSFFGPIADGHGTGWVGVPHDRLILKSKSHQPRHIDTASGQFVRNPSLQFGTRIAWERAALRNMTTWRTTDGRRVWMLRSRIEYEKAGGGFGVVQWRLRNRPVGARGYGLAVWDSSSMMRSGGHLRFTAMNMFSLDRMRLVTSRPIQQGEACWVLGDRWLLVDQGGSWTWRLLDPETGDEEVLDCLHETDRLVTVLDQHRVLVYREVSARLGDSVFFVNLKDRSRTPARFAGPDRGVARGRLGSLIRGGTWHGVGPGDKKHRLFLMAGRWVTLPPGSIEFTKGFRGSRVVGFLSDTRVLVIRGRTLVEVEVETGEDRVLFPREETH